jgi:signal transduction histidine kinase
VLRIHDDGKGFDPLAAATMPSLGLLGIRERAGRLGGCVDIRSGNGKGTLLVVRIPAEMAACTS